MSKQIERKRFIGTPDDPKTLMDIQLYMANIIPSFPEKIKQIRENY
jgi:hypothetical protein